MFKSNNNIRHNDTNNANNVLDDTRYNDTNNVLFIAIYVDDISLFGPKGPVMNNLKDLFQVRI